MPKNGTQRITNPDANAAGMPKDTMPRKDRSVWCNVRVKFVIIWKVTYSSQIEWP